MNMKHSYSPLQTDYSEKYSDHPRMEVIALIPDAPERVLEIGCGTGATGMLIKQKFPGTVYVGVDVDETAAAIARPRLDQVIVGNIEQNDPLWDELKKGRFDLVICADVLEHLYDPWKVLYSLRDCLVPGGRLIASIPNVQNLAVIMQLIGGSWTYTPFGLLDATHIRFFTWNEIGRMFQGAGYQIIQNTCTLQRNVEQEAWPQDLDFGKVVLKGVTKEEALQLFTFQYLIVAVKENL